MRQRKTAPTRGDQATSRVSNWFLPQAPKRAVVSPNRRVRFYHHSVIKWYPGEYAPSIVTCCTATKTSAKWRECGAIANTSGSMLRNSMGSARSQHVDHEIFRAKFRGTFEAGKFHRDSRTDAPAAPGRARRDLGLSPHALTAGRLQLPSPADLLGLWRRSDRSLRAVGRRLDDIGAVAPLPPLRHQRA